MELLTTGEPADIDGVTPIADITEELAVLHEKYSNQNLNIGPDTGLLEKIGGLRAIAAQLPVSIDICELASGLVLPGDSQKLKQWHNIETDFYAGSNVLPTQVLVAPLAGRLSCRSIDVLQYCHNHVPGYSSLLYARDDEPLKERGKGLQIVSLQPNILYYMHGFPFHRSAINATGQPVSRTFALLSQGKYIFEPLLITNS